MADRTSKPPPPIQSRHARGVLLCLVSACAFGGLGIFGKYAYDAGLNPGTLLSLRFAMAAACFWGIVLARRSPMPSRRLVFVGLALGAVGYAAQSGLFFAALERIQVSLLSLLLYTYPALVFVGAVALGRDHATPRRLGALGLALTGVLLVLAGGDIGSLDGLGIVMALGAAAAYTTYILVADRVVGQVDPFALPALVCTGACFTFTVAAFASGRADFGFEGYGWAAVGGLALVSTVLAITTFFAGMHIVGPSTASIVSTAEPAVTVALAALLFGESLGPVQLAGGGLVLVAVVLLNAGASSVPADGTPVEATGPAAAGTLAREPA